MMYRLIRGLGAALALFLAGPAMAAEAVKTAVFDLELVDTSMEGERAEHRLWLRSASEQIRRSLAASGKYAIVAVEPAAARVTEAGYLHGCNGCEAGIARDLGAQLAIAGVVHKVSTLILQIAVTVRDAQSGEVRQAISVEVRGDTEESWVRGARYIAVNRL
jgi:Protein of unknown function (DUF2380)